MEERDNSTAADGEAPIRVLIVEDHAALGEALLFAFGFEAGIDAIGVAPTIATALERVAAEGPDVVLMDVRLPDGSGLDAAGRVKSARPGTAVVIMTAHADQDDALRAAEAGAAGFILKDVRIAKVVTGVRRAVAGEPAIDPSVLQSILNQAAAEGAGGAGPAPGTVPKLTPTEHELVALLAGGAGRDAVTEALGVGEAEVAAMTVSLQERLGARSVLEALVRAARIGLLEDPDQARARQPR
ncbi:MAG TPA: response regulator transcription factor [Acidimicrobiia bacterium]|nr:response regulator transcription factor [Acidimicrobiia bacterium]